MVRLVFRPYTQIPRWICTSQSLRASTRVSPGFALLRHSSPSFGSQHVCSHSNLSSEESWSVDGAPEGSHLRPRRTLYFHCAPGFATPVLAYMLDSLVRVSRRVKENHFVKIRTLHEQSSARGARLTSVQPTAKVQGYNIHTEVRTTSLTP